MAVPDFQSLMLPTLGALRDGSEAPVSEVRVRVASALGLTPDDLGEMLPSGRQLVFTNRVAWALSYMMRAGLVERVRRGTYRLTDDGKSLLSGNPARVDLRVLRQYPSYVRWKETSSTSSREQDASAASPEEALDQAATQLREELEADVLEGIRSAPSEFLEQVVVDLLVAMGYGGGDPSQGRVTGGSGDGGIDGTIREDALGLDEVYLQAKRYAEGKTVSSRDLQNFAGAIDAAGTTKGVFVTTAGFTRAARDYVERSPKRIVLIDGEELARLMVQHDVGVRTRIRYEIKRIDETYFDAT